MTKIAYGDKTAVAAQTDHSTQWWAEDANDVKDVVNENDTTDTSTSATLTFDKVGVGRVHGTSALPITSDLVINDTINEEGGVVEVVWYGSSNPNITGVTSTDILTVGSTISAIGTYSIFIIFTGGKYKVNILTPTVYSGSTDEKLAVITVETLATITAV